MPTGKLQLKKTDFLHAVTETPVDIPALTRRLQETYDFVESYLIYLVDYYIAKNKIVKEENGSISRKVGKREQPKVAYRVGAHPEECPHAEFVSESIEENYFLQAMPLQVGVKANQKIGEASTPARAVKLALALLYQDYKKECEDVRTLLLPCKQEKVEQAEQVEQVEQVEKVATKATASLFEEETKTKKVKKKK